MQIPNGTRSATPGEAGRRWVLPAHRWKAAAGSSMAKSYGSGMAPRAASSTGRRASKGLGQGMASADVAAQDEPLGTPQLPWAPASARWHLRSGQQQNSFVLQLRRRLRWGQPGTRAGRGWGSMGSPAPAASLILPEQGELGSPRAMHTLVHGQGGTEGAAGQTHGQGCSSPSSTPGHAPVAAVKGLFSSCSPTPELSSPRS